MAETKENVATPTDVQPPTITFKKRSAKARGNVRERRATPPASPSDDYSSSSENESGNRIKRRKKNTGVIAASSANNKSSDKDLFATVFTADRNAPITSTNDATKQSNWFDEDSKDAPTKSVGVVNSKDTPKRSVGPIKAPTNVRTITVTDFAPDVCKDYKQTGFCGFGDSCKYLHAREDYKHGWQLDREWENVTKGKKHISSTIIASADRGKAQEDEDDEDAMLENIPFACIICKESYKDPIITRCGHYFCEPCALKRYRKDPTCAACGSGTNGVFNSAKQLKKLLDRKRERAAAAAEQESDDGE